MVENEYAFKVGIPAGAVIGAAFNYALPSFVEGHPATLPEVGNYLNLLVHANPGPLVLTGISAVVGVLGGVMAAGIADSSAAWAVRDWWWDLVKKDGFSARDHFQGWEPGKSGPWDQGMPFPYKLRHGHRIWKRN